MPAFVVCSPHLFSSARLPLTHRQSIHPLPHFRHHHPTPPCVISAAIDTTPTTSSSQPPPLILGLNQYTHDASLAVVHASTGILLFAQSKERLSRRKHDAGSLCTLVQHAVSYLSRLYNTSSSSILSNIRLVIANNHHFRILPFESRLALHVALGYSPSSYLSPYNLIAHNLPFVSAPCVSDDIAKFELSHHLAHAFSAACAAPARRGLVVVMDGMGDALDAWLESRDETNHGKFYSELTVPSTICQDAHDFVQFPTDVMSRPGVSFREAETAYLFEKNDIDGKFIKFTRLFKRWTPETAPSELPNHSFEEMQSVGAMYSRVSAIIFNDWNTCGKVMGLAPYGKSSRAENDSSPVRRFLTGHLIDGSLSVADGQLQGLNHVGKNFRDSVDSPSLRHYYERMACDMQSDLEDVISSFISQLLVRTEETNLVLAGGVALNSTLNGLLSVHPLVQNLYVPPYPGDEGIAIGCALFGHSLLSISDQTPTHKDEKKATSAPTMPYLGCTYDDANIARAIQEVIPWVVVEKVDSPHYAATALAQSQVVAWFNGRSEFGPRALGNRSLLADPRRREMIDVVNNVVKKREAFRPFAPTVLAGEAAEWFEDCSRASSPFMSLTKQAKRASEIEAVVHVDGTSRLQTLEQYQNPEYHALISHFRDLTGIPMVMNTSFNIAGEPIVESPRDALRTFLNSDGIDLLIFPGVAVRRRKVEKAFLDNFVETACSGFRSEIVQGSDGSSLRVTVWYESKLNDDTDEDDIDENLKPNVELIDALQLEILENIHQHARSSVAEVLDQFSFAESEEVDDSVDLPSLDDLLDRIVDLHAKRLVFLT